MAFARYTFPLIAVIGVFYGCERDATPTTPAATAPQSSQAPATTALKPHAPLGTPPLITFDRDSHDFGTISELGEYPTTFTFTNTGGQRLIVEAIKTSCGCTTAELVKRQYEPGESGTINVTLKPSGAGPEAKLVNIISNAHPDGFSRLMINANTLAFLDLQPRIMEPGVLEFRKEHHLVATISCPPDDQFTLSSVVASNPHIVAHARPASPGEKFRTIDITVLPTAPWGNLFSWIEVTGTGRPAPGAEPITHTAKSRVQSQLFGKLRAHPDTFRFGAKPGERFERTIKLTHINGEAFELRNVSVVRSDLPNTTVASRLVRPGEYAITLTATADRLRPTVNAEIMVQTNVPGEEQVTLPMIGVVRVDSNSVR